MPDLSLLSDDDLKAVASGNLDKVSDGGLKFIAGTADAAEQFHARQQTKKSGYEGVPDENLNFLQKAERGMQKVGLIKPGYEEFSPGNLQAKKDAVLPIAAGAAGAAGLINAGPAGLMGAAKRVVPAFEHGLGYAAAYALARKLNHSLFGNSRE